jgi:hypothetical protein
LLVGTWKVFAIGEVDGGWFGTLWVVNGAVASGFNFDRFFDFEIVGDMGVACGVEFVIEKDLDVDVDVLYGFGDVLDGVFGEEGDDEEDCEDAGNDGAGDFGCWAHEVRLEDRGWYGKKKKNRRAI